MKEQVKNTQLEIEGRQAIKDIQGMINPKWNEPKYGNYDGPLDLLYLQVKSCRDMSGVRKALYFGDEEGKKYAKEHAIYKRAYKNFLRDIIYFKRFLEQPYGQVDIEKYMMLISEDENRAKNFRAIIKNILIREDLLMLDFELMDQIYRIHELAHANQRG